MSRAADPRVDNEEEFELEDDETQLVSGRSPRAYPWLLIIGGGLGFLAAMGLTIDRFTLLANPQAVLACDINPFVACGPVMSSAAGSLFGFPNPLIGIAGFAVVMTIGAARLAGARFADWFMIAFAAATVLAGVFITWLQSQSLLVIGKLCPWCMLVWTVTIPIVVTTVIQALAGRALGERAERIGRRLAQVQLTVIAIWYLLVIAAIGLRFYRDLALYWFQVAL